MKLNRIDLYVILAILVLTYAFSHRYYIQEAYVLDGFTGETYKNHLGGK